jgi:Ca-activated chloride channel family protein
MCHDDVNISTRRVRWRIMRQIPPGQALPMTRAGVLLAVALLAVTMAVSAQGPVFRTGVDLVTFGVTVTDRKGNFITDLTPADFTILEDGGEQKIQYFTAGTSRRSATTADTLDGGLHDEELGKRHLGLMLDTSGSMEMDLSLARSAAVKFLKLLPEAEDITVVDFDTEVRITRYPQRDFPRLVERIRQRKPDGWTALYDALGVYLDGADQQDGRKILVMYTDGGDTRSELSWSDTLTLLKASDVTVYAVGLVDHTGSARSELRMRLQQMTETTGGQAFFPDQLKDLDSAYAKILDEIKAQYHLGFASTNAAQDGTWRKVEIKLKRPDLRVRARKGYFAPMKSSQ